MKLKSKQNKNSAIKTIVINKKDLPKTDLGSIGKCSDNTNTKLQKQDLVKQYNLHLQKLGRDPNMMRRNLYMNYEQFAALDLLCKRLDITYSALVADYAQYVMTNIVGLEETKKASQVLRTTVAANAMRTKKYNPKNDIKRKKTVK